MSDGGSPQDPLQILLEETEKELVLEAYKQLTAKEKAVMDLYYGEGLSGVEVARALGVTDGRVSHLRLFALAKLKRILSTKAA